MDRRTETTAGRRASRVAFALACAAIVGIALAAAAGAKSAKVLGKTRNTPPPACPRDCQGVGRVTGFPLRADGVKRPFNIHRNGSIVAFALDLSRPKKKDQNFFGTIFESGQFGKDPSARLAVIRRKGRRHDYKLLRQSPGVDLSGALGHKEVFTLDRPLRVRKGQIVALSYPSWASNFAFEGLSSRRNQWRASRSGRKCSPRSNSAADVKRWAQKSSSQQKIGSVRRYGCDYKGGRLLYWAYFVRR